MVTLALILLPAPEEAGKAPFEGRCRLRRRENVPQGCGQGWKLGTHDTVTDEPQGKAGPDADHKRSEARVQGSIGLGHPGCDRRTPGRRGPRRTAFQGAEGLIPCWMRQARAVSESPYAM